MTLRRAFEMFAKDLEALPEEAFDKRFGPKVRTVADIVTEVNMVNDHIILTILGKELFEWPEGWIKAPENCRTKADVIAAFEKSSQSALSTIESFSPEQLSQKVQTEHGETTIAERAEFIAWHVGYHSGQLNYVQTLMGDDDWHW